MATAVPRIDVQSISKFFGTVIALKDISMQCHAGEVMALLGDNGAGKSTLIKALAGVHKPDEGQILIDGTPVDFNSPREALDMGIATVYQDLALVPLISVTRNFFMGREPTKGWGPFSYLDMAHANKIAHDEMLSIGIDVRDPTQAVGTMSGGERQCLAISRAVHFGARVLILDEPTSALGVKQAGIVLRYIAQAKARGLAVILITHNVHHAYHAALRSSRGGGGRAAAAQRAAGPAGRRCDAAGARAGAASHAGSVRRLSSVASRDGPTSIWPDETSCFRFSNSLQTSVAVW